MPRKTGLTNCVRCESDARVGVYSSYYGLSSPATKFSSSHSRGGKSQIKGSFPARGFCVDCFLRLAKGRGVSKGERTRLRRELDAE
jgi:hypothetical protein